MKKKLLFSAILLAIATLLPTQTKAYDFSAVAPSGHTLYYNIVNGNVQLTSENSSYPYYTTYPTGSLTIPSSVTHNDTTYSVTSIGYLAFTGCIDLTSLSIPPSITSIDSRAFTDCSGFTSIIVESGNSVYDSRNNCNALIETATNTIIRGCQNTVIPNSITSIGDYAFNGCTGLTDPLTIPNSVTSIGESAFFGCTSLTSVTIPTSVTSIESYAFYRCTGITSITIPNSVTTIGGCAFGECSSLTSVTIPNSVTSIGGNVLANCSGLLSIIVESGNSVYDSRNNCNALIETATNTIIRGCQNTVIPNSITSIGYGAFNGCIGLTSITIPNSVTYIGHFAFQFCKNLTSITIPNSITNLNQGTFSGCSGLISVTIPNSVVTIGYNVFQNCSSITSLTIPNSVTYIGKAAFRDCDNLTSITIPNSVTTIIEEAFWSCDALTSLTIGNSVSSIGDNAFTYCENLTEIRSLNPEPPSAERAFAGINPDIYVYVPCERRTYYQEANGWSRFTNIIEDCESIGDITADQIKLYSRDSEIVIEGADNSDAIIYDIMGRIVHKGRVEGPIHVNNTGVYMVKIANQKPHKVVVR